MDKPLSQLYAEHTGKVSDKWSSYLSVYDRLFKEFRHQPINMLEIGVQNGGSLELWSKYFPEPGHLIGCDINPGCANLEYEDPRVSIIVGDATAKEIRELLFSQCNTFNIVIDDGSHLSEDIVKAFFLYFPSVVDGGVFVAEDLHCGYWAEFGGGLAAPFSCISFFKHLADIVNYQHWGVDRERGALFTGFSELYGIHVDEDVLATIHSVEFFNSICIVRKRAEHQNRLGSRFIAGQSETVVSGHSELSKEDACCLAPSQNENPWSSRKRPPAEELPLALEEVSLLKAQLSEILTSRSWRFTRPLRGIASMLGKVKDFFRGS